MTTATQNIESAGDLTLGDARHSGFGGSADDRSDDLPAPLHAEGAQEPLLLESVSLPATPGLSLVRPHRLGLAALQPPFLEGPQRPPCSTGIFA